MTGVSIPEMRSRIKNVLAQETPPVSEWELRAMLELCERVLAENDK